MEFRNRYSDEEKIVEEILSSILTIMKTFRPNLMFTRAGIEQTLGFLTSRENENFNQFLFDLSDCFLLRIRTIDNEEDVEFNLIKRISEAFDYRSVKSDLNVFGKDFSEDRVDRSTIEAFLSNNRTFIVLCLLRFCNFDFLSLRSPE